MTLLSSTIVPGLFILPFLVFLSETCVVTLSTIRTIFVARGKRALAALLGFFEVSIWLFAIGQVMQNLNSPDCFLAFATGFSLGNFLGVSLERKLALGTVAIHITTPKHAGELISDLRSAGYGVTCLNGEGANGPVQIIYTVVPRKEASKVAALIKGFDAQAFYSISDLHSAAAGILPLARRRTSAVPAVLPQLYRAVLALGNSDPGGALPALKEVAMANAGETGRAAG